MKSMLEWKAGGWEKGDTRVGNRSGMKGSGVRLEHAQAEEIMKALCTLDL